ncbi:MAG: UDP-3-O-(3-hydroxymyristoyl)glucosamine N-acyltransferase [Candidatus Sumerlaeaceae bacterium]
MRVTEFAAAVGSRVENLEKDFEVTGISTLEEAQTGQISFVADHKYVKAAEQSSASAVIVPEGATLKARPFIRLKEPWSGVLYLLQQLHPHWLRRWYKGVHASSYIDSSAILADDVAVGPHAVIGPGVVVGAGSAIGPGCVIGPNCTVGANCTLGATSVLEAGTVLGDGVIVQAGAVLGGDGFKYEIIAGQWTKIPQVGRVVVGPDAEIGANTTIDRASFTQTRIGANTKIDNLVQVGHNVTIGANCIIVSQTGIAGSTEIGDGSILAAQVGIKDNLKLGKGVVVLARAGVTSDVADGEKMLGFPARPFRQQARIIGVENRLPELAAEVARLTKKVEELEKRGG